MRLPEEWFLLRGVTTMKRECARCACMLLEVSFVLQAYTWHVPLLPMCWQLPQPPLAGV
jgi:hypothetical protein